jgi:c-di-GMP-binding flagellar brake protein YcgR
MQSQVIWSRFQIIRLLRGFIREERAISVEFEDEEEEKLIVTRALQVNARTNRLAFAFGDHKRTNSDLLRSPKLLFSTEEGTMSYRFGTGGARDYLLHGELVFGVPLPDAVILSDRRRDQRLRIPDFAAPTVKMYFQDGTRFDGKLADLSEGGIGLMGLDSEVPVRKGAKLRCLITLNQRDRIWLDVEVRFVRRMSGVTGKRVGVRLLNRNPEFEKLLKVFRVEV